MTTFTIPNHKQHLVPHSQNGLMDRSWYRFFDQWFANTGKGQIDIGGLPASIAGVQSLALLALNKRDLEAQVDSLTTRLANLEAYVAAREI